ncbi:hypothetical protein AGABI1DRAFT_46537 [Agaricus bisporus var. burnettii JB137-S8]|uniref:Palmitoyltransferase n=1 Tax=Agaricus bisporus var. burnettii (strain JB137-S8 / ATCC MYA-4627 / FGSC 10392) TaxID=597362 RepID=K5XLH3_AGABU|nr:uncharacterized protein AGABI1DRAFT_46537 [Agaricus bisporus var. burnettii JB137-S8]EKM75385.1 hypothetical protein AGABI1DRAFT_46537 [Agaricus bisporus var. burnettii JB137-S8]
MPEHQCCGVVEEAALHAREKRANRSQPSPWIAQKIAVVLTLGIMGYAGYVYIGRFCKSIIKQDRQSSSGRATGIVLLVIFCVLYLWMIWAYVKVVVTPPGFARDHILKTPQPYLDAPPPVHSDFEPEVASSQYRPESVRPASQQAFDPTRTRRHHKPSYFSSSSPVPNRHSLAHADPIAGRPYEEIVFQTSSHGRNSMDEEARIVKPNFREAGVTINEDDGGVGEGRLRAPSEPPFSTLLTEGYSREAGSHPREDRRDIGFVELGTLNAHGSQTSVANGDLQNDETLSKTFPPKAPGNKKRSKRSLWEILLFPCGICFNHDQRNLAVVPRRPVGRPALHPVYRYCARDGIVKPHRAHHCRNCGTCVLKFDHHCPWIGQCVGARNHKFFLIFCVSAAVFALYLLGTLIGFNVSAWTSTSNDARVDPQIIVVSALALLFSFFTVVLTSSHIMLILKGQTTVESMSMRSLKERESEVLRREFGLFAFRSKREARRQWKEEWGDLDTEGNIWWTGSKKQGWIDVMGKNPLGWILPVGRSETDGLSYPLNSRFDEQGQLKRRVDWPAEQQ